MQLDWRLMGLSDDVERLAGICPASRVLGPVNTNPIGSVASEKVPIKARGMKFGHSK
jgi:hypothetical protein